MSVIVKIPAVVKDGRTAKEKYVEFELFGVKYRGYMERYYTDGDNVVGFIHNEPHSVWVNFVGELEGDVEDVDN